MSKYIMIYDRNVWYFEEEDEMTEEYHALIRLIEQHDDNINDIVVLEMIEEDPMKPSLPDRGRYVEVEPNFPIG